MTGELILTSNTYDEGRIAINDSFSGTAIFNILSANTFYNPSSLFSASTGINSIITNNSTGNLAAGDFSFVGGTGSTANSSFGFSFGANASTTGIGSIAIGSGAAAASSSPSNPCIAFGASASASASAGSSIAIGNGASTSGVGGATAIGQSSTASGTGSVSIRGTASGTNSTAIQGGSSFGIYSFARGSGAIASGENSVSITVAEDPGTYPGGATTLAPYSVILGGGDSIVDSNAIRSVIIGMSGYTATSADTVYMTNSYIDGYFDLNPQTVLPSPKIGRIFFSGTPLNRLMQNTGGTVASWCII